MWNWQQKDWPQFSYKKAPLDELEKIFLHQSGFLLGIYQHLNQDNKDILTVDLLSNEAYKTSEIEGEYLNRDSLRSSIRRYFGLGTDHRKIPPSEQGIAEMMVNLYQSYATTASHQMLCEWHLMLTNSRLDLHNIGSYRTHEEAMQVVSGSSGRAKIHFEAPAFKAIPHEMDQFIRWFNRTAPEGKEPLPALVRAGIAHLYFVCIHPFEDGNGRIARALAEKALSQSLSHPTLIALSHLIQSDKKSYYSALEYANKSNEISEWLIYFAKTILAAQDYTKKMIQFLVQKTKLYDKIKGQLNIRQEKVIARLFQEGLEGFKGGLSAENYIRITQTSRATATRDLQDLVDKAVLNRTGERKSTRYILNIEITL
jgi:Fic family protein